MNLALLHRLGGLGLLLIASLACAGEPIVIKLPRPQTEGGRPLMQTLQERKTTREFGAEKLSLQMLSNLLWAAYGVNRPATGSRTAPSAHDRQTIDVYATTSDGAYLYDAKANALQLIVARDIRALTGIQDFVKNAAVNLVYVSDFARMGADMSDEDKRIAAAADVGFIGQNVYLFAASENLATVVRGSIDKEPLAKAMHLRPSQWIILAQSVGYMKQ